MFSNVSIRIRQSLLRTRLRIVEVVNIYDGKLFFFLIVRRIQ